MKNTIEDSLNNFFTDEASRIKESLNAGIEYEHIFSDRICIMDIRYAESIEDRIKKIFGDLKSKLNGRHVVDIFWTNIRDNEHNPLGNTGRFLCVVVKE